MIQPAKRTSVRRITAEHASLADLRLQGDVLSQWSAVDRLYDPDGEMRLRGSGLDEKLKAYQQMLRYDEGALHDTHKIAEHIQKIKKKKGVAKNLPSEQVKESVKRLTDVIRESKQNEYEMEKVHRNRRGQEVESFRWSDIKENFSKPAEHADGDEFGQFRTYFSPDDAKLLRKGDEGVDEWAHRFLNKIYGFGRERAQPDLPEMSRWDVGCWRRELKTLPSVKDTGFETGAYAIPPLQRS